MKFLILLFSMSTYLLFSEEQDTIHITSRSYSLTVKPPIAINLEHAVTPSQLIWGLMKRTHLPWNSGMSFDYLHPQKVTIWMFNMNIDLSVAFLDSDRVIRGIANLQAYPSKMDPKRPVNSVKDIERYPPNDPIREFFRGRAVSSSENTRYVLEMNEGWFEKNGVKINDVVLWDIKQPYGFVLDTIDIGPYLSKDTLLSIVSLNQKQPISLFTPNEREDFDVIFTDENHKVLKTATLKGGAKFLQPSRPVVYTITPTKYIILAPPGWIELAGISQGSIFER